MTGTASAPPVRHPLAPRSRYIPGAWSSVLAAFTLLSLGACAKSDTTGPGVDQQPTVSDVSLKSDAQVYLRADLNGSAVDPEGKMQDVVIDWGDQSTVTLTSGFDAISNSHDYREAGTYTVTVTATDASGNQGSGHATVDLLDIPRPCIDLVLISGCLDMRSDFDGATAELSILNVKVASFALSTTKPHAAITVGPVRVGLIPYPWGQLVVDANFSKTKGDSYVRFRLLGCILPGTCPGTAADKKVTW